MRILMLTTSFPLYKGHKAGVFVYEQARHLCRAGQQVTVLAPADQESRPASVNMAGVMVRRFRYFWPEAWQRLCYGDGIPENMKKYPVVRFLMPCLVCMFFLHTLRLARTHDTIYAHWTLAGLAGMLAGKLLRKPVVVMIHHGQERYETNCLEKYVIEHADQIVCNSTYTRERVKQYFRPRHCMVIPPGVDTDLFHPEEVDPDNECFHSLHIPPQVPVIFSLGRHIEWKGYRYLLQAVALFDKSQPCLLVIGGQGPQTIILKKKAKELGISGKVRFPGGISNEKTPWLYNRAAVFVQPSIVDAAGNTEGLGVVLMEAMACGTPCVASVVGGIPDLVKDGYNGFLVPPEDPEGLAERLKELLTDEALNRRMGKSARQFIQHNYAWPVLTGQTLQMLTPLIGGKMGR